MITEKVREYLKNADLARARAWNCAASLAMSDNTFRRRLRAEGTRYSVLLVEEKRRRAAELLERNPRADTHGIARVCGLRQRNNVTRTFRQLFGINMREFKRARP